VLKAVSVPLLLHERILLPLIGREWQEKYVSATPIFRNNLHIEIS
jgi:hypothetical protein